MRKNNAPTQPVNRIPLGNGRWFCPDTAKLYEERMRWNGSNHISCATGSQWEHEQLYRTVGGTYVLHAWSQWQGSTPSYEIIGAQDAHAWLIAQGHSDAVPPDVVAAGEV